jgi:hypothetical protein
VSNTIASNTGVGIAIGPTGSAIVTGVLSKVMANNNVLGIAVVGSTMTIVDSEASNNRLGISVGRGPPATVVMLRNVVVSNNKQVGLSVEFTSICRVAHSVITGNLVGVDSLSSPVFSYGDNDIDGNITDVSGTLTPIATR